MYKLTSTATSKCRRTASSAVRCSTTPTRITSPLSPAAIPPRLKIGVDTAKLKQARAQVQQAEASLKQLEEQLGYTTIVAPMDGVILSRDVEIGDAVSSILVLGSTATLVMTEGDVNEVLRRRQGRRGRYRPRLPRPARPHQVESFRRPHLQRQGHKISPMGVEKDNVIHLRGARLINNPAASLKALMTANAEFSSTSTRACSPA